MKKQPRSYEMHSKGFFPGLNIWSQYSIHICGDFFSLSSSEVLIMTCAHSFPAESVQEREITSADMACCCFTMHTDRCFQTQNTLAYLKNETHRHTWNTNTCIHGASLKDKTHRHALHKAAVPLPDGHLASLPWPAAVLDFFGKNYPALQRVSRHWIINGYLLKELMANIDLSWLAK